MGIIDTMTSKLGPFPVWAYGVAGGGVVGIFIWRANRKDAEKAAENGEDSVSTDDVISPQDEALVDSAGWGASPYTSGAATGLPASNLMDDGLVNVPINPQTGNPYAVDVAMPINPATGQPYAVDFTLGEERARRLESDIDRLQRENEQIMNRPPAATPSPEIVAPGPPAPIVTTPAPAPRPPVSSPAKGTVVWTGSSRPVEATINNLIATRYGRPISWRTVDNGAGKTPRFKVVTQ